MVSLWRRPFNWEEPNHDLTGVGFRVWRECMQIHRRCVTADPLLHGLGDAMVLETLMRDADRRPDYETMLSKQQETLKRSYHKRRSSVVEITRALSEKEYPRHTMSFVTELISSKETSIARVLPQVLMAVCCGVLAQVSEGTMESPPGARGQTRAPCPCMLEDVWQIERTLLLAVVRKKTVRNYQ